MDDNFDMSDFVNFDQGFGASPPPTSALDTAQPNASAFNSQGAIMHNAQQYNGPSFNYSQFPQQVGLPSGGTQHIDAVNAFSRQTIPANFNPARLGAYNASFDMESEAGSSSDAKAFFPNDSMNDDYAVDPSALGPDASKSRAWPGMHSQQAKDQETARQAQQQSSQQRRDQQMSMQRQLPMDFEQTFDGSASGAQSQSQSSEPQVNEQISKLLNQMRHNSDASSLGDLDNGEPGSGGSSLGRMKKDEDDMDEDERLLASEEGKKLTSKERRQLRNKVSARAFRSRRKEYITQLEGEVQGKINECDELKQTNRHLLEQNRQLTQLTKAMLAHPAFNNFMSDMSNDPSFLNTFGTQQNRQQRQQSQSSKQDQQSKQQQPQQQQSQQQQPQRQESIQVGMSMIPESNLDFSMLNLGGNHWGQRNVHQPQIFAVFDVPEGPAARNSLPSLNPKSKEEAPKTLAKKLDMPVADYPVIATASPKKVYPAPIDDSNVKDDPNFALYAGSSCDAAASLKPQMTITEAARKLGESLSQKSSPRITLKVSRKMDELTAVRSVDQLFASLEDVSDRVSAMTWHLPL